MLITLMKVMIKWDHYEIFADPANIRIRKIVADFDSRRNLKIQHDVYTLILKQPDALL